ncbi:hypothetical protein NDU88_002259 [Pleurodeles waltl]|uniref:Uncharacterized protein n=1 Tax=Pleurodeles waltl TaxID=8319 RepID=A0AAV7UY64_PLEWA|nr:hypothetical protein NDU88_002259 [Pleurodeles waltl]
MLQSHRPDRGPQMTDGEWGFECLHTTLPNPQAWHLPPRLQLPYDELGTGLGAHAPPFCLPPRAVGTRLTQMQPDVKLQLPVPSGLWYSDQAELGLVGPGRAKSVDSLPPIVSPCHCVLGTSQCILGVYSAPHVGAHHSRASPGTGVSFRVQTSHHRQPLTS